MHKYRDFQHNGFLTNCRFLLMLIGILILILCFSTTQAQEIPKPDTDNNTTKKDDTDVEKTDAEKAEAVENKETEKETVEEKKIGANA